MPDYEEIYRQHAEEYDLLIAREDYQHHLFWSLEEILPFEGQNVVEFGAGTGRLTTMLAPVVQTIRAYDSSSHMLAANETKLKKTGLINWYTEVADHRNISAEDGSADIAISGWSMVYLALGPKETWRVEVSKGLAEMQRVVRVGGTLIIIETLGTGFKKPHPPDEMRAYLRFLEKRGFKREWIRTDYQFKDMTEAMTLTKFFFGEAMIEKLISTEDGVLLPECTGIWHRKRTREIF